ncbi:MAG: UDP-N-acetylmuramoyl-L-alanyl-D-glutamate-2,6-diaminopimelate ligase [Candidatus Nomurabacteria bacterium GW2011_GWB1_37_5]|uniref:UDP-N-acetylmuramoyl-L-alanyl-D-glutamate-2, 6-diaminopimelate ligase n=1 Tax=Candidatus Nomurabacteria bacterium GW2011_GWB1_37_5 TaxID=1618742 RepID=A0A0G0K0E5_9BACT|nr:MAG: UDP-N-acetylmuramoyl-L-alanyl-D-glutamate-2,6-diaminopimelate ligase [Candidatus Nomurabacteria bacterium GW2011_GWB1_37_5]
MNLKTLIRGIEVKEIIGMEDPEVSNLFLDSQKVEPGGCFFAVRGKKTDGHEYISQAIAGGAKVVVCERLPQNINDDVTYVLVESTQKVVGSIASSFYDYPSKKMKIIGVTGTNGKTTITALLYQLFELLGEKAGLIGTVENYIHKQKIESWRLALMLSIKIG